MSLLEPETKESLNKLSKKPNKLLTHHHKNQTSLSTIITSILGLKSQSKSFPIK